MKWWDNFKEKRAKKIQEKRDRLLREGKLAKRGKVALCLGGGGARGFAHVGAIKAFIERNIKFDMVVGTSAGSLVGALYAGGASVEKIMSYADALSMKDIKSGFFLKPGDPKKVGKIVTDIIGEKNIEDLSLPFYAVATDLVESRQVILDSGSVSDAVSASCAVPLVFKPVVMGEKHLVDGGLLNNIPADVCRMLGADIVITVDVNPTRGEGTEELGLVPVLKATFSIMSANSSERGLINSDIIIATDLSKFRSTKKDGYEEMVELGYRATMDKMDEVIKLIYK